MNALKNACPIELIAFFLPQFHPIPENDAWWGVGFTEWRSVVKAKPRFRGHYQPHLPADLGFYDLRLSEVRESQARLARQYNIHGFCYYHYWFNGRRILQRPLNEILSSGKPDFPFCICWANENWTRRWDGFDQDLLLKQAYSSDDDIEHIRSLIPIFKDERYIKVEGKPLFLIYRLSDLPEAKATVHRWREEIHRAGLPGLYLCCVESFSSEHNLVNEVGADAAVEFAPDWSALPHRIAPGYLLSSLPKRLWSGFSRENHVSRYSDMIDAMLRKPSPGYRRFRCVTPMWDNSARRKRGAFIAYGSTPEQYERWLRKIIEQESEIAEGPRFVFINAWNEWAEGCHLEPCERWGHAYLKATARAISTGVEAT